jgi:hypothetical protein
MMCCWDSQEAEALDEWHCGICLGTHEASAAAAGKTQHKNASFGELAKTGSGQTRAEK